MTNQTGKKKRMNNFTGRLSTTLEAQEAANPCDVKVDPINVNFEHVRSPRRGGIHGSANSAIGQNVGNNEATSKIKKKRERGKYKSCVVDMKIKGKQSKLSISIPDEIDRAISDNARHLVNECGRVVRTRAPLDVKNWQEAFARAGDGVWKEIQRLYRIWKTRLHYYYKSPKCGKIDEGRMRNPPADLPQDQWEYYVKRFSSAEFKTKENNNVKPTADVIWLAEDTRKSDEGVLQWADQNRSKEIYDKLKNAVANAGESKTQEEILLEVLPHRSGYFRGKGTAIRPYTKGRQQLLQQKIVEKPQEKIQEQ
ncbi:hypothetical protein Cgig2_017485 [Carnegiea gigantea]|uniref:Transposase, Ptta/En/Spm, plant n=1 Tax=Carnegiea gigantea TaxID=171969 RepID=A0A9Q1GLR6_9CARY|nr:hypothetical protein Cgig2_017485 [Carnegiea gigantea]